MRRLPDDKFRGIKLKPDVNSYRLFLAIYPTANYISYFRDVLRFFDKEKRNLRNIAVDQIHLTLKFIGASVSEYSKDLIIQNLQKNEGKFSKPQISLTHVQFGFKYQYDPRVLMAKVKEDASLLTLFDEVHNTVKDLRLMDTIRWKEKKVKDFHITISRLKKNATRSSGKEVLKLIPNVKLDVPEPFYPEYIEVMDSKITQQGPVYRKIAKIKL